MVDSESGMMTLKRDAAKLILPLNHQDPFNAELPQAHRRSQAGRATTYDDDIKFFSVVRIGHLLTSVPIPLFIMLAGAL